MPAVAIFGNAEVDVEPLLVLRERPFERTRWRDIFGRGHVEQETVRQDAGRRREREAARGERLAIDLEPLKAPGTERECRQLELEEILEKPVLGLEVLRTEKNSLCPQDGLHLPHGRRS